MGHVAALWRHPIKSHGREALTEVTLAPGQTMPWDRHWAVTHDKTKFNADDPAWVMCRNFMIGAVTPGLGALGAVLDPQTRTVTLTHNDLGSHSFRPDDPADWAGFLLFILPLCPADGPQPKGFAKIPERGVTDTEFPSISINNTASHRAVAGQLGRPLERERWRGNIWLDGLEPWEEFNWLGRTLRIGAAELEVRERIGRCKHTMVNPQTGMRDADTLGALRDGWDHQDFGVYAIVTKGGKVALNDPIEVI